MKDVEGNELKIGDEVVFTSTYCELYIGTIVEFTPKKIRVQQENSVHKYLVFPIQVFKKR